MFVRHSVYIDRPVAACTDTLMSGPRKRFPRLSGKNVGSVGVHIAGVPHESAWWSRSVSP